MRTSSSQSCCGLAGSAVHRLALVPGQVQMVLNIIPLSGDRAAGLATSQDMLY